MDPAVADLIKFILGGAAVALAKSVMDIIKFRREGRSMKEANLVTNLSTALEREERDHDETRSEVASLRADLNHEIDKTTYWRNYAGRLMFLLSGHGIEFEQPKREIVRRESNERPE